MRLRRVISRSGLFSRTRFPSVKMGRTVHCEGENEYAFAILLEADGDVVAYPEQAMEIYFEHRGKQTRTIPDFVVTYVNGHHEINEVKRETDLRDPDLRDRLRAIGDRSRQLGYPYRVRTDLEIRQEPRLSTAQLICRRGRREIDSSLAIAARHLAVQSPILGDFQARLGTSRDDLCALILQGHVSIALDAGLIDQARIRGLGWKRGKYVTA